jgi:hypothetical protein
MKAKTEKQTDPKFTKLLGDHIANAKGFLDYGVERGLTSPQDLRLTIAKRVETVRALKDSGMSQRKIASAVGVSKTQIIRDLGGPKGTKNGTKGTKNDRSKSTLYIPNPDAAHVPFRKGWKPNDLYPGTDMTYQVKWRGSIINRARASIVMKDEDWSMYQPDPELIEIAKQALDAWKAVITKLERR